MNREKFLRILNTSLKKLPEDDQKDIIQDFQEHFDIGRNEGKTEEEIAESLGSPHQLGKELTATHFLGKAEGDYSAGNIFRAVWAVIGLGFFNLVIVLAPFIAILAVLFAGWVTGVAFIISPLLVLINPLVFPGTFEIFDVFFSIALTGLGLFITIGMVYATKFITTGFVRYLNFNAKLVKGGLKHE